MIFRKLRLKAIMRRNEKLAKEIMPFITGPMRPKYSDDGYSGGKTTIISDMALEILPKYEEKLKNSPPADGIPCTNYAIRVQNSEFLIQRR